MSSTTVSVEKFFKEMVRCRIVEETSLVLFEQGLTPGRMHSYVGEEAVAVGVATAMRPGDLAVSTHRGGAHLCAMKADIRSLYAEYMGRAAGYSGGLGGPMHISVPSIGFLCTNGIVGSGIPVAVGAAMALKRKEPEKVVVCFFGDGAANTGSFHEGLNMAGIWGLPVLFVCENNGYAETLPVAKGVPVKDISSRSAAYGFPGVTVDGNDVEAVYGEACRAIARASGGGGPTLIETKTYRIGQHFSGESNHYRTAAELDEWKKRDPIEVLRNRIVERGGATPDALDSIVEGVRTEVVAAAEEAKQDPFPEPEAAFGGVYRDICAPGATQF